MSLRKSIKKFIINKLGYELYYIAKPITEEDINRAQRLWASGIMRIGRRYRNGEDYVASAEKMIDKLYSYEDGQVLFKPTNAKEDQFRIEKDEALSYFIGAPGTEDEGFAIKNWSAIKFNKEERYVIINKSFALAMGNYYFTEAKSDKTYKLEYTLGYKRSDTDNHLEIFLHHSSYPYKTTKPVKEKSDEEIQKRQKPFWSSLFN